MNKFSLSALACACLMFSTGSAWAGDDHEAAEGKAESCEMCHGEDGAGDGKVPAIAGMSVADFTKAMKEYADGTRDNKIMAKTAKKLSDQDIADLAAYFSSH